MRVPHGKVLAHVHLHLRLHGLFLLARLVLLECVHAAHIDQEHGEQSYDQVTAPRRWPHEVLLGIVLPQLRRGVEFLEALDGAEIGRVRSADCSEHVVAGEVSLVNLAVDCDTGMD